MPFLRKRKRLLKMAGAWNRACTDEEIRQAMRSVYTADDQPSDEFHLAR